MKETIEQKRKRRNKEIHQARDYHWDEYCKINLLYNKILEDMSVDDLPDNKGSAMIIDRGYSLKSNLKYLKDYRGTIFCCDRAAEDVIKAGRVPEYIVNVDSSFLCIKFYLNHVVRKHMKDITGIFCTTSNPYIIDNYKGPMAFFLAEGGDERTDLVEMQTGLPRISVGGNVLTTSWNLAVHLGAKTIGLVGCDNGYSNPKKKEHKGVRLIKKKIQGETRYTDEVYNLYTRIHLNWIKEARKEHGIKTINCSKGVIHSRYTTPMRLKDFVKKYG